jgi:hypothetical protein
MNTNVSKFVGYQDLEGGADPYPFMVIEMGQADGHWEAHVHNIASDDELKQFLVVHSCAPVVFAALKMLHPVRFRGSYMYIPVKSNFFEVLVPFDG